MCLLLNDQQNVLLTAHNDMLVWKVLKECNESVYFYCKWTKGETKTSPLPVAKRLTHYPGYKVSVGLHAFISSRAAYSWGLNGGFNKPPEKVVAMTIPEGASYYVNKRTHEIVTSALRWEKDDGNLSQDPVDI